jgi:hypothetical protein
MSAATDDATAGPDHGDEIRAAMAAATTENEVELALDVYAWANPLDVIAVDDPIKWDVRYGDDWWTRTITVEGGNGAEYALVYSSAATPPRAACYRVDDDGGRGDKRGDVDHLVLVEDLDDGYVLVSTAANRSGVFHRPDSDDPSHPVCSYASKTDTWYKKQSKVLGDDWSLCQRCDDSEDKEQDGEYAVGEELPTGASDADAEDDDTPTQASAEEVLPDDIDESDVSHAVGVNKNGGFATIGDVAETLGLPVAKTRTILVVLDLYSDVKEVTSSKGGGRRA